MTEQKLSDRFTVGQDVKLHPASDLWMRGATQGTIERVGRKWLHVRTWPADGKVHRVSPRNILGE